MSNEKPKVVHVKKFDGGRRSPAEYAREMMYKGTKCSTCGGPPAMRIRMLADASEFQKREPQVWALLCAKMGGSPTFKTKYGDMVHIESIFACDRCKAGAKRFAAHKPSWVVCEFEEMGLDSSHPLVVQVPR
jgi:hypothetical protein